MKPSIPKGTRDFSPTEMVKRNYIFDIIKQVFQRYGYLPIETPAMENLSTLMGKYGEEGDKLIFKILNSGNYMSAISPGSPIFQGEYPVKALELSMHDKEFDTEAVSKSFLPLIVEKALRYDLTVPFARYVVQHQHEITFPFKR